MSNIHVMQRQTVLTLLAATFALVSLDTVVMANTVKVEY